ncbi:MAG: arginase [Bdellovibrio sp. CG12_big_fil_rev_8_21_14_0_65_39_13]|nr:MAG: arginase [Bdellovibrio sp. CG22_combo_CG10-13_8_21_14_all_39_27]PIQ57941.1 MAG: arginase [Bdellovibrio sp. CG12_big_fil_rev_8_21_14_0_65_39_13]PIR36699.1 MAG: arginase [Bdellovibrio sp. CG11_big_fil_rev_8_21_14_0_20_39_38]
MNNDFKTFLSKTLVPPGNGVYTVNTAKERKQFLNQLLYNTSDNVQEKWLKSLEEVEANNVILYGICSDTGGGILRGANWGPLFLRSHFYQLPYHEHIFDIGDIRVIPHLLHDKYLNKEIISKCRKALYGNEFEELPVSPLSLAEEFAMRFHSLYPHKKLVMLGGDHSVSYPAAKAFIQSKKNQNKKCAILHFDAHTDLLDHRLGIDICFGSWAYHMIELLSEPELLIQVGIRSSGKDRSHWESTLGVTQFWSNEVMDKGSDFIVKKIEVLLKKHNIDEIYLSFDIDALDEKYASATGTPEPGGLTPDICHQIIQAVSEIAPITGADLVEVAPMSRGAGEAPHYIEPHNTLESAAMLLNRFLSVLK